MATTVTTLATDIQNRYLLGAGTAEPSSTHLATWIRAAFKFYAGDLLPVKRTTGTLSGQSVTQANQQVLYVARGEKVLVRDIEWEEGSGTITLRPTAAIDGDTVTIWYAPTVDTSGTTIDTDTIWGSDWLEELVLLHVAVQVYGRLSNMAGSEDGAGNAGFYRVLQTERDALYKMRRGVWDRWQQSMEQHIANRIAIGDLPGRESPLATFENQSVIVNRLTGVG